MNDINMKRRNSTIEAIRIVAAIGILLGHSASKGGGLDDSTGINNLVFNVIVCFANWGSIILAMISFYFMYASKPNVYGIIKIWFKSIFYSFSIAIPLLIMHRVELDYSNIIQLLPIIGRTYWFVCTWIVFALFRPILDYAIYKIKYFNRLCIAVIILFVCGSFIYGNSVLSDELIYFLCWYLMIVYIKQNIEKVQNIPTYIYMVLIIASVCIMSMFNILTGNLKLVEVNSPFMLISSICVICLLIKLPATDIKLINFFGGISLGIYLFHCHPYIKDELFWKLFSFDKYINTPHIYIVLIIIITSTIITTAIMEIVCSYIYQKILKMKIIRKFINNLDKIFKEIVEFKE